MCRRGLSYLLWRSNPLLLHTVLLVAGVPRSHDDTKLLGLTRANGFLLALGVLTARFSMHMIKMDIWRKWLNHAFSQFGIDMFG